MSTKLELLTPTNCQVIFIDHQPQMAFGVQSIDRQVLKNNTVALAKAAKVFKIPVTITTVETESFSGHTYPELLAVFPEAPLLERTSMNSWDDQKVRDALAKNGRKKVVVSGLWTEVCNNSFALSAMAGGGYEIYMVADASGATSKEAQDYSMQRMIQAGVVPVTWQQVLLEWQRDWARRETYDAVMAIVKEHSGAYGMGVDYAYTMVHKADERVKHGPRLAPVRLRYRLDPSSRTESRARHDVGQSDETSGVGRHTRRGVLGAAAGLAAMSQARAAGPGGRGDRPQREDHHPRPERAGCGGAGDCRRPVPEGRLGSRGHAPARRGHDGDRCGRPPGHPRPDRQPPAHHPRRPELQHGVALGRRAVPGRRHAHAEGAGAAHAATAMGARGRRLHRASVRGKAPADPGRAERGRTRHAGLHPAPLRPGAARTAPPCGPSATPATRPSPWAA